MTEFPIDLDAYQPIALDANNPVLSDDQRTALKENIQLCRDALVFFYRHRGGSRRWRPFGGGL